MPIPGIKQPELIQVDCQLRLRKYDGSYDFAFDWYQDLETVYLVDGLRQPYTQEKLTRMYEYLNAHGELYFIEILENGTYQPIGDVTFRQNDIPIVIGNQAYRGRKIGQRVIQALIRRGKSLGYPYLQVNEIYEYNIASRRLFEQFGFQPYERTEKGIRYRLELT